ncbi:MAG: YcaO-like family protein [Pseudomonadota bacterium]|nr:YcaO-like family protein [Pseudomonadota bacterium]
MGQSNHSLLFDKIVCAKGMPLSVETLQAPRVSKLKPIKRPDGYFIPGFISGSVFVSIASIEETGFSDSRPETVTLKATSEALERLVFRKYFKKSGKPDTTNGWACHLELNSALENALCELIERDVALTTWENSGPFYEIPKSLWPSEILKWADSKPHSLEYPDLKIYLCATENGCAISSLLFNERGNFVTGHASGLSLKNSILSATAECFRSAHAALRFEHFSEVSNLHNTNITSLSVPPGAHSLAYAYSVPMPSEVVLKQATPIFIETSWSQHQKIVLGTSLNEFEILTFKICDYYVVRLRSLNFKKLFWGKTSSREPLTNKNPHFVG